MKTARNLQGPVRTALVAALALALGALAADAQCAMCREALGSDPDAERVRHGFTMGILFLGVMLLTVAGAVVVGLFRAARSFSRPAPPATPA